MAIVQQVIAVYEVDLYEFSVDYLQRVIFA